MRKVIVSEFMTLDGVVQAPGGADEDTRGGFEHGGWQMPYFDEIGGEAIIGGILAAGGLLLGRRTYEIFAAYWPTAPDEVKAFSEPINALPKYVASTTLTEPLAWENSTLIAGDVGDGVAALKEAPGDDLLVIGSGNLVRTLMERGLVDEYRLMIHPIAVGGGGRLFQDDGKRRPFRLVDSTMTTTGVAMLTYEPAGS